MKTRGNKSLETDSLKLDTQLYVSFSEPSTPKRGWPFSLCTTSEKKIGFLLIEVFRKLLFGIIQNL